MPDETIISIEIAERMLSRFDGDRNTLNEFISNCNLANKLLTADQQKILLIIIKSKITGKARALIDNYDFNDFTELKNRLLDIYPQKIPIDIWELDYYIDQKKFAYYFNSQNLNNTNYKSKSSSRSLLKSKSNPLSHPLLESQLNFQSRLQLPESQSNPLPESPLCPQLESFSEPPECQSETHSETPEYPLHPLPDPPNSLSSPQSESHSETPEYPLHPLSDSPESLSHTKSKLPPGSQSESLQKFISEFLPELLLKSPSHSQSEYAPDPRFKSISYPQSKRPPEPQSESLPEPISKFLSEPLLKSSSHSQSEHPPDPRLKSLSHKKSKLPPESQSESLPEYIPKFLSESLLKSPLHSHSNPKALIQILDQFYNENENLNPLSSLLQRSFCDYIFMILFMNFFKSLQHCLHETSFFPLQLVYHHLTKKNIHHSNFQFSKIHMIQKTGPLN